MTTYPDLIHPLDDLHEEARERFTITDDGAAAWAMRKLRAVRAKQAENARLATDEHARIDLWLTEVNAPLDRDATYFEAILGDYALRCRENPDDGRKSLNLPTGKVSTRVTQPKWSVDADAFLGWARTSHPDLIRVKEEADLAKMKETLDVHESTSGLIATTPEGELVPGVTILPGGLTTSVTPDLT